MNIRLCYRIDKEAEIARDINGDFTHLYACRIVNWDSYTVPADEYIKLVDFGKALLSGELGIEKEHITPITLNEYLDAKEDEQNSFKKMQYQQFTIQREE
ncbi:MAG: hypothetical protein HUJ88_11385 [Fusobacterium necrophorum]|nr:hypothetical protein [Fusobacterium necrophorum]